MKKIRKIDDENFLNIELSQLKDEQSDQLRNDLFKESNKVKPLRIAH